MIKEIVVPDVGESINEVTIAKWLKQDGEYVELDELLCEIESDKATLELPAEEAGNLQIVAQEGTDLKIGDLICKIDTAAKAPAKKETEEVAPAEVPAKGEVPAPAEAEKEAAAATAKPAPAPQAAKPSAVPSIAAAKMIREQGLDPGKVAGSGPGGRITKQDILALAGGANGSFSRETRTEKLSRLRKTISRRLVAVKNKTAMLTTFNEVDMSRILEIRKVHKEKFLEKHGVKLGFMSFFTKACCVALQDFPAVNGMIGDDEVIYHDYCDISIAVSTERGLVVPVVRNAESLSMAEIESKIVELATKAHEGKLGLEEMEGGTFTITNGGVFGSMMSTPIINAPQSAILGMHNIVERPMATGGKINVLPMMYLAVSYDHRIIDGKESVSFLVRVKELLEDPAQLLMGKDTVTVLLDL